MAKRVAVSTLNASTVDIMNVIRQNAGYEYQANVPKVNTETDIPKVGEVIYGTPALANKFLNELLNRIALVTVKSATFNNPYNRLKKGYLAFGETIEEVFVSIAKGIKYDPEKAEAREFKRTLPDVRTAFHIINWRVMYPVTIQDEDLKQAFTSMDGVQMLIAKIVDSVYTGAEYDEFLLFKYLLIKSISHGQMKMQSVDTATISNVAVNFRAAANLLTFMGSENNVSGVLTNTPRDRQIIFMDATFNAQYDVEVLAGAFNMDKADFIGRLYLIDHFDTFDNDRFDVIRQQSDGIEDVTAEELTLMKKVKAVILDEEWFQCYDNNNKFTEKYVASGLYWNYFYHTWKTVSFSPFANAICFVDSAASIASPGQITLEIMDKDQSEEGVVMSVIPQVDGASLSPSYGSFIQTEALTASGIGITKYGAVFVPKSAIASEITLVYEVGGVEYTAGTVITAASAVGATTIAKPPTASTAQAKAKVNK